MAALNYRISSRTRKLVQLALFTAIIVLMALTPIGYLKIGPVSITLLAIPVAIGAVMLGPWYGAYLGFVFGLTSFVQCFGTDPFGTLLFGINGFYAAVMCFVPRVLMGLLVGLIFKGLSKICKGKADIVAYAVATISGAVLNTVLFVTALLLLFGRSPELYELFEVDTVVGIILALVTFNAAIEAGVTLVVGTAIAKALVHFLPAPTDNKKKGDSDNDFEIQK